MQALSVFLMVTALGACASPPDRAAARREEPARDPALADEIALKSGRRLDRICQLTSVNDWRALDRHAVLVRRRASEVFLFELSGRCRPDVPGNAIAFGRRPPGASCVDVGDRMDTIEPGFTGSCRIKAIYEWRERAETTSDDG